MSAGSTRVLVVSDPQERDEILNILRMGGFTDLLSGSGGDATFTEYEEHKPEVVVVCAHLDHGDARSLASAMRDGEHGRVVRIVLIGEESGPIRNALDAADFEVDRFVGRPLSAKALTFAVQACAEAAAQTKAALNALTQVGIEARRRKKTEDDAAVAEEVTDAQVIGEVEAEADADADADADVDVDADRTARQRAATADFLDQAMSAAIDDFVALAISSVDDVVALAEPVPPPEPKPKPEPNPNPNPEPEPEPEPEPKPEPAPEPQPEPQPATSAVPTAGVDDSTMPAELPTDDWEPTPIPVREPTLILSDGGASGAVPLARPEEPTRKQDAAEEASLVSAAPVVDDIDELAQSIAELTKPLPDDLDDLSDLDDDLGNDSAPPASGGSFARELRQKMSKMAERLFPTAGAEPKRVDVGVAHDHQTEIDLASIDASEATPYDDFEDAVTYTDTRKPVSTSETKPGETGTSTADHSETTGARRIATQISSRGELGPRGVDPASLFGKLFNAKFTGRVMFSKGKADKAVFFEEGRPSFATSNLPHDRMGDLLFREGKITRQQHASSRQLVAESGRRMGEILIEMGFLKRRELLPAVRRHVEDVIYSLFAWDSGEYQISSGDSAASEKIRVSRHPAAIVLEGVRRKYEMERLERIIGSSAAVVETTGKDLIKTILSTSDLSDGESAAVSRMDGEQTLGEICEACGLDPLIVHQVAFSLVALGAAEVIRSEITEADDEDRGPSLVGETDLAIDRQRVMAKYELVAEADYFSLLGVRRDATSFEIKRAYEAARRDYAAESFPSVLRSELSEEIGEINELLDEAYQVLRDDRLRGSYVANLRD